MHDIKEQCFSCSVPSTTATKIHTCSWVVCRTALSISCMPSLGTAWPLDPPPAPGKRRENGDDFADRRRRTPSSLEMDRSLPLPSRSLAERLGLRLPLRLDPGPCAAKLRACRRWDGVSGCCGTHRDWAA